MTPQPENLAATMGRGSMFSQDSEGKLVTRERTCECGRRFTQRLLSERFLTIVEKAHAMATFRKEIPDFFVPVHCPACERVDLGRAARIHEYAQEPRPTFGERDAA